jgi:hypothetical membrane protein
MIPHLPRDDPGGVRAAGGRPATGFETKGGEPMTTIANKNGLALGLIMGGLVLAASPWLFDFAGAEPAIFSAKVIAAGLMLVGLGAYVELRDWARRGAIVAALACFAAPVLLGFEELAAAAWSHGAAGLIAVAAAGALLWSRRRAGRGAGLPERAVAET